jgi:Family of unknown function (DUF5681)
MKYKASKQDPRNSIGYSIGYRRPPIHTRFKPGQSGNPKGRPKGIKNPSVLLQRILKEKVTLREGDKVTTIPKMEAMIRRLIAKALMGDAKAFHTTLALLQETGPIAEPLRAKLDVIFVKAPEAPLLVNESSPTG